MKGQTTIELSIVVLFIATMFVGILSLQKALDEKHKEVRVWMLKY